MLKIERTGQYESMLVALYKEDIRLRKIIREKVKLFRRNPDDTRLRNHPLTKKLKDRWAFSITSDIRIVYGWIGKNAVRFLAIGQHDKVYKRS